MVILITGASGFIGTKLLEKLLLSNAEIIALSRSAMPVELNLHHNQYLSLGLHYELQFPENIRDNLYP